MFYQTVLWSEIKIDSEYKTSMFRADELIRIVHIYVVCRFKTFTKI